jgi:nitrogen fixation NifU-like protein
MNDAEKRILEHYKNPLNFGKPAWKVTHQAKEENAICGDELNVYIAVENDKVKDIKFDGSGCSISIAAMSLLTEKLKGKSVDEIKHIDKSYTLELLGIEVSESRLKCTTLGIEAIHSALLA